MKIKVEGTDTTRYTYDYFGNLITVILPNKDRIDYIIDGQNRRIGKSAQQDGGCASGAKVNGQIVKRWLYSGQLSPVAELDSANNIVARFIGNYMIKEGNTYQLITDHLGSVRFVVNVSTGEIVQRIDYDEYGNVTQNTNPDFTPFSYAGGLYDAQTKLVRFGTRDYEASVGRWTSKDPIGFNGGVSNLFEYCVNDPVNGIDTEGLQQKHRLIIKKIKPSPTNVAKGEAVSYYLEAIEAPWWSRVFFEYPIKAMDFIPALFLNTEIAHAPGTNQIPQIDEIEYQDEGEICPVDATETRKYPKNVRLKGFRNGKPIVEFTW